ncbi:hypothetical protein BKA62DRAFT_639912 [Auriculariales sp. MPI-PUGE-AT-0066]|nr:hypothetical protein BKA62DRAFT_639912 [Auriculariales sp. MPI-PUGE-AT-0066]
MSGVYILSAETPSKPRVLTAVTTNNVGGAKHVPAKRKRAAPTTASNVAIAPPAPKSNYLANLSSLRARDAAVDAARKKLDARSTSFTQPVQTSQPEPAGDDDFAPADFGGKRDESLKLVEELKMGPYEHKPIPSDPNFKTIEPHSRIRLSGRRVPHEEFADMLRGRYYISPSQLYSVARLQPDRSFDVPVDSDWVTVAVVAHRSPILASVSRHNEDDSVEGNSKKRKSGPTKGAEEASASTSQPKSKPIGSRFVRLTLIDFGTRDMATGAVRGDAELNLLLFEHNSNGSGPRTGQVQYNSVTGQRLNMPGARSAFEDLSNLREGTVVALLNPRILRPQQSNSSYRGPAKHLLGLTPPNAESVVILGQAKDLGFCEATSVGGKVCRGWYDTRAANACDYHVTKAVQSTRAHRPEFTASTAGLSTFAQNQAKKRAGPAFDPLRKTGLLAKDEKSNAHRAGSETYVFNGHTLSGSAPTAQFVEEKVGRAREDRKRRVAQHAALERMLDEHVKSGLAGAGVVVPGTGMDTVRAGLRELGKAKGKERPITAEEAEQAEKRSSFARSVFTPEMVKDIGFDPLAASMRREKPIDSSETAKKAALLMASARSRTAQLRKPGQKIRSGIVAPSPLGSSMLDLDDDDLEIEPPPVPSQPDVDLDSDSEEPQLPIAKRRKLFGPDVDEDMLDGGLEFPDSDDE